MSTSSRFTANLGYTKMKQQALETIARAEKTPEREIEKE